MQERAGRCNTGVNQNVWHGAGVGMLASVNANEQREEVGVGR